MWEDVYFAEFQAQVSPVSEYFEEILSCAAMLPSEHIEKLVLVSGECLR